ncbi:hypothetical protein LZ554_001682 [Drepanopeziza brunnea f. sp. 'monogermtubi']|nr:hypothetical protein LZ554_001682 [Drepanopeziza brunnea f. sp. 'monogermtubi']
MRKAIVPSPTELPFLPGVTSAEQEEPCHCYSCMAGNLRSSSATNFGYECHCCSCMVGALRSFSATISGYEYIKDAEAYVFEKLKVRTYYECGQLADITFPLACLGSCSPYTLNSSSAVSIAEQVHIEMKYKSNSEVHGGSEESHIGNNRVCLFFLKEFFANIED